MKHMIYISEETASELLRMDECIPLIAETLRSYARKEVTQVLRTALPIGLDGSNWLGVMPAVMNSRGIAGCKLITIFPGNGSAGLESHQGVVALFETVTGTLKAVIDGGAITAIRTAAASAVATEALAREDSRVLAILGTGIQARRHVEALRLVRKIEEVRVWGRSTEGVLGFKKDVEAACSIPVVVCETVRQAVVTADIVCTVTAATEPVLLGGYLKPGIHVNAVGACRPNSRELDTEAIARARLFGDSVESVTAEAGDFIIPFLRGEITRGHLLGEIGEVLIGAIPGRTSEGDITVFKSLGIAIEDLAAAELIYNNYMKKLHKT